MLESASRPQRVRPDPNPIRFESRPGRFTQSLWRNPGLLLGWKSRGPTPRNTFARREVAIARVGPDTARRVIVPESVHLTAYHSIVALVLCATKSATRAQIGHSQGADDVGDSYADRPDGDKKDGTPREERTQADK